MILQTFGHVTPAWSQKNQNTLTYGELLEKIEQGKVKKVEINPSLQAGSSYPRRSNGQGSPERSQFI